MKDSFLKKIKILMIATIAALGFVAASQTAMGQAAPTCFDDCFNQNANNTDLLCCGQSCDARQYCDNFCACGNGAIDTVCDVTEQCDDGNTNDGDGCSEVCMTEEVVDVNCGDGILNDNCGNPEECDDGNTVSGDGCDANCNYEPAGGQYTALPTVNYRGIATNDLIALRTTVNTDLNIAPRDFVVAAVKGVSFAANPGPADLKVTVMPKLTAALNALLRTLFHWTPESTSVPMSLNVGCVYPKNFCFPISNPDGSTTTTCAKGCRETAKAAWGIGTTACPTNIGCCTQPPPSPLPTGWTPDPNYTCTVLTPGVADAVKGNGLY